MIMSEIQTSSIPIEKIRIDNKNSLNYYDNDSLIQLKQNLFTTLASLEETNAEDIVIYIEKLLMKKCKLHKKFKRSQIFKHFFEYTMNSSKNTLKETNTFLNSKIPKILEQIKNGVNDNSFILNNENSQLISTVILSSFQSLNHLKNEKDLIKEIDKFVNHLSSDKLKPNNEREEFMKNVEVRKTSTSSSVISIKSVTSETSWDNLNVKDLLNLPDALKNLLKNFTNVKSLKFNMQLSLDKPDSIFDNFILVYMNLKWLYLNVCEITIDLETGLNFIPQKNKKKKKKNPQYKEFAENKNQIDFMLISLYFISCFLNSNSGIKHIKINIPYNYDYELKVLSQFEKLQVRNFHILDLINLPTQNIETLNFSFNSIDSITFQRIISIIHSSNHLKDLNLDFFPQNHLAYLNFPNLNKILNSVHGKNDFEKVYEFSELYLFSSSDKKELVLNKLIQNFEMNLEYFIQILKGKLSILKSLKIDYNIPQVIFINDRFLNTLFKFTLNMMLIVHSINSEPKIEKFELCSNNFPFSSKKFLHTTELLEEFRIYTNDVIKHYKLNFRFNQINKIDKLLPIKVQSLDLSQFDNSTFSKFLFVLENENLEFLVELKISISDFLFQLSSKDELNGLELILRFFEIHKRIKLNFVYFSAHLEFSQSHAEKILGIIICNLRLRNLKKNHLNHGMVYELDVKESLKKNFEVKEFVNRQIINLIRIFDRKIFKNQTHSINEEKRINFYKRQIAFLYKELLDIGNNILLN